MSLSVGSGIFVLFCFDSKLPIIEETLDLYARFRISIFEVQSANLLHNHRLAPISGTIYGEEVAPEAAWREPEEEKKLH